MIFIYKKVYFTFFSICLVVFTFLDIAVATSANDIVKNTLANAVTAVAPTETWSIPYQNTPVMTWPVHNKATATKIAERNQISVQNFCEWNNVKPSDVLVVGTSVYLQDPKLEEEFTLAQLSSKVVNSKHNPTDVALSELAIASFETWPLRPGGLQDQIGVWAERAGYQLVWNAEHDYQIPIQASFNGDFLTAMQQLIYGLNAQGSLLRAKLYESNKILEITEE